MADDVEKMLTALNGSNDKNGRKDVKDRNKDLPPPQLVPKEKTRTFNVGTILADAFFAVKKKHEKDTFGETETPAEKSRREAKEGWKVDLPELNARNAAIGIAVLAFTDWISDFLGPFGEFFTKTLPKLFKPMTMVVKSLWKGIKGGKLITTLTKIGGKIGSGLMKFGRFIPFLGSLFSFGFGIVRWNKGEKGAAIFEFISGIVNLIPGFGWAVSILIDGGLLLYDLMKETDGSGAKGSAGAAGVLGEPGKAGPPGGSGGPSFWDKIHDWAMGTPVISNIMSLGKGWIAVFKGEWREAADHFDKAFPWVGAVIGWIADAAEAAGNWFGEKNIDVRSPGEFFMSVVDKFVSMFTDMVKSIYNWIADKATEIVDNVKEFGGKIKEGAIGLGKGVANFFLPEKYEFQDFSWLARGNKAIPFSNKDDVIGMKPGGVLDKVFTSVSKSLDLAKEKASEEKGFLNKMLARVGGIGASIFKGAGGLARDFLGVDEIVNEIKTSNRYLQELVRLTDLLLAAQGGNAPGGPVVAKVPPSQNMSGELGAPVYSRGPDDYVNSAMSWG